jgi:hypothetical protein
MKNSKAGFIAVIATVIAVIVLIIAGFFILPHFLGGVNKDETEKPGITYQKGDINQDGKVDVLDQKLIRDNLNCTSSNECWNKIAGYNESGNNPIYVRELDLNGDSVVNEQDLSEMNK